MNRRSWLYLAIAAWYLEGITAFIHLPAKTVTSSTGSTFAAPLLARKKKHKGLEEYEEEEKEEGVWRVSDGGNSVSRKAGKSNAVPWQADLGPLDPFLFDPEDLDGEDDEDFLFDLMEEEVDEVSSDGMVGI